MSAYLKKKNLRIKLTKDEQPPLEKGKSDSESLPGQKRHIISEREGEKEKK